MLGPCVAINLSGLSGSQEHQTVVGTEMVGYCPTAPIRHWPAFWHTGEDGEGDDVVFVILYEAYIVWSIFCFEVPRILPIIPILPIFPKDTFSLNDF